MLFKSPFLIVIIQIFTIACSVKDKSVRRNVNVNTHVFKETAASLHLRNDLMRKERVSSDHLHEVIFAVKLLNMDELTRILLDVSDPMSKNYGKHKTRVEVTEMTANPVANEKITEFLNAAGASIVSESLGGEYITARGTVAVWETIFNTKFYNFDHIHNENILSTVVRAEEYSVPLFLYEYVDSVFHTVQMPHVISKGPKISSSNLRDGNIKTNAVSGSITPTILKSFYNINGIAIANATQEVYATLTQHYRLDIFVPLLLYF